MSPGSRYLAWGLGHQLKSAFKKQTRLLDYKNIRDKEEVLSSKPNDDEAMYYTGSMPVILVANKPDENKKTSKNMLTLDDIGKIVFKTIQENTY